jgi:hypothetical protein
LHIGGLSRQPQTILTETGEPLGGLGGAEAHEMIGRQQALDGGGGQRVRS